MATNCEPILPSIPQDADLLDLDCLSEPLRELLHAAVQIKGVLIPVATKVLHRKRRSLVPMLDSVVIRHYLSAPEYKALLPGTESKDKAATWRWKLSVFPGRPATSAPRDRRLAATACPSGFPAHSCPRSRNPRLDADRASGWVSSDKASLSLGSRGEVSDPQGSSTPRPRRVVQSARAFGSPPGTCLRTRVAVT